MHKFYKHTYNVTHKNHVLAPIVGKDFEQKFFLGFVLGVLEGLINRGSFRFSIFTPSSVQCNVDLFRPRLEEGRKFFNLRENQKNVLGLVTQFMAYKFAQKCVFVHWRKG